MDLFWLKMTKNTSLYNPSKIDFCSKRIIITIYKSKIQILIISKFRMCSHKMSLNVWIYLKALSMSLSMAWYTLASAINIGTVGNAFGHVLKTTLETFDSISSFEILYRDGLSFFKMKLMQQVFLSAYDKLCFNMKFMMMYVNYHSWLVTT